MLEHCSGGWTWCNSCRWISEYMSFADTCSTSGLQWVSSSAAVYHFDFSVSVCVWLCKFTGRLGTLCSLVGSLAAQDCIRDDFQMFVGSTPLVSLIIFNVARASLHLPLPLNDPIAYFFPTLLAPSSLILVNVNKTALFNSTDIRLIYFISSLHCIYYLYIKESWQKLKIHPAYFITTHLRFIVYFVKVPLSQISSLCGHLENARGNYFLCK